MIMVQHPMSGSISWPDVGAKRLEPFLVVSKHPQEVLGRVRSTNSPPQLICLNGAASLGQLIAIVQGSGRKGFDE